ncbi:LacI family DNA-binding transcriptional regulator [Pseudarthrobacter sulfonivorans]|uniref:LacI family DNA-binding transcriptional regulator n=1 Tax=Pseudarthrobacter sulfonivorans TaxID=121292 RepID=UPI00285808E6|nr:LacI family DNA-binding transcriptional regulator [Pseudarthrobacter sulfonivorans]MDR6417356.1 DNA-binding LacI/PurR family transcriptional regulator [Pseudarthrobacter sulfonivorans]
MTARNPQARRPTIYDVAKLAGVSPSLVSLVLQNPDRVSEKRREAVRAAIAELGYRPSRAATTLASSRTKSIGLVIDDYRNLWFVDLLRGMESALTEHGYHVTLADSRPGENRIKEAADGLLAMHVDGLVIAAEPGGTVLTGTGVPTVVAGWRNGVPPNVDLITNDDDGGGALAADHLLGLGHTRIGHLSGSGGAAAHRRAGFDGRVRQAGAGLWIAGEEGGTSEEDGYASACWLLDHYPETTAIFAANDTMALGAFGAIKARGLAVPADISVIGYDNSTLAKSRYLELTSVDNRSDLVGVDVAKALLERIQDPTKGPKRELIKPSLVVRGTTARPSA